MVDFVRRRKKLLFVAGDGLAVLSANLLAVLLRFDFDLAAASQRYHRNLELLVIDLVLTPLVFAAVGLYQGYWKYAGLDDLIRLGRGVAYRTVALIVVFYGLDLPGLSRAVLVMSTVLLLLFAGALRLTPRFYFEFFSGRRRTGGRRAIIIGAGDTGEALLRELKKAPHIECNPIGFIDDDREKAGVKIHGVPVLGDRQDLERLIEQYGVREVIVAIPGATGRHLREIFDVCRRAGARIKTVPTRGELERGAARVSQIRPVEVEDLLGRDVVNLDEQGVRRSLGGARVLVTGAAGSIGRELARQIARYEPVELILLDRNENSLFSLEAELREAHPVLDARFVVGDVLDRRMLETLFVEARPDVVFHAAAYKHVPLMEQHPAEAVKNNVVATRMLLEIAATTGSGRVIYISTDKAVQPSSVMGATKRLGERMVRSMNGQGTRFIAVRFGNVLGSDGSVIPTFRRQIASGGPVTVTHPEATRYFMTIPEAVQLVLHAGTMGEGGEVFLLQMGSPVRILDMARSMIELSGLEPDKDISIVFTGLRPGEKLHEDLRGPAEEARPTSSDKILALSGIDALTDDEWAGLRALEEAALAGRADAAVALLAGIVKDYVPRPAAGRTSAPQKVVGIGLRRRMDAPA